MPWELQVRVIEEPSGTGSGESGVMNGTGKAGGGRKWREGKGRGDEAGGGETELIENMLY